MNDEICCPECGSNNVEKSGYEWRCKEDSDDCEVITFIITMHKSKKGDRRERELVNMLDGDGLAVMRAPASGGATTRELPDVLAGNGDNFVAVEAKSSQGDPIYIKKREVYELFYFSKMFGAKPRIGVRFNQMDWYFFHPSRVYRTDSGNLRIKKETAESDGDTYNKTFKK